MPAEDLDQPSFTGSPVTPTRVAIIDSGLDLDAPIFRRARVSESGYNFGDCHPSLVPECAHGASPRPIDKLGHGTLVAGVFVTHVEDLTSRFSIEAQVELLPIKVNPGSMNDFTAGALNAAIEHAMHAGARVINLSIEMPIPNETERQMVAETIDRAVNAGAVLVVAAGNREGVLPFPASQPNVIAVEALGDRGKLFVTRREMAVTAIAAPSTSLGGNDGHEQSNTQGRGTSFAAPRVAASAAVAIAVAPCLTGREIRNILFRTADTITGIGSATFRVINAERMVAAARTLRRLCP